MDEIVFGTPEHIEGLSRQALEADFRWVLDRRTELEGECERLATENAKLVKIIERMVADYMCCADIYHDLFHTMHEGERSVYKPECAAILERIGETYDGIKIRKYLDQMKEMGHEL